MVSRRTELVERVTGAFRNAYGHDPAMLIAAPGRVNLIGEHLDYNDGFVLPCAIDYETIVAAGPASSGKIRALACDFGGEVDQFEAMAPFVHQTTEWRNHVRGIVASITARGVDLEGTNLAIAGNVPRGAGLSSSASLGVALAKAFAEKQKLAQFDASDLALIAQQAENDFVGCACGIMDQFASAHSKADTAMLLDCRSRVIKPISIPDDIAILIIHTGIERGLVDSAFNERREQCERAAAHYGVAALRDLDIEGLEAGRQNLDDVTYRRACHVVTENTRTLAMVEAFNCRDMKSVSRLMEQSHHSMRDDFEITLPAIDGLVKIISGALGDTGGVRMTGGGFGGCIVALVRKQDVDMVKSLVIQKYQTPDGKEPTVFQCVPSPGASVLRSA